MFPTHSRKPYLAPGQAHLWLADFRDWMAEIATLQKYLSKPEHLRLARYRIPAKKEQFTISRGLLRLVLALYLRQDPAEISLMIEEQGKPILTDRPIQFNLSHTEQYFALGITPLDRIGVDIQEIYPISSQDQISRMVFSDQEILFLDSYQAEGRLNAFFALWTAKEAYLKAIGDGFTRPVRSFSLLPRTEKIEDFDLDALNRERNQFQWTVQSLDLPAGIQGAAAVAGQLEQLLQIPLLPEDILGWGHTPKINPSYPAAAGSKSG